MKTQTEIEQMADTARTASGWQPDGTRTPPAPANPANAMDLHALDQAHEDRAYAEGVEAGLRWATGAAGPPFPR